MANLENKLELSLEEVERNKSLMDLKPNFEYINNNVAGYRQVIRKLLAGQKDPEAEKWVQGLNVVCKKTSFPLQITPEEAKELFSHLPAELLKLSGLKELNYDYHHTVLIPDYDEEGFCSGCSTGVKSDTFPRQFLGDGSHVDHHPTRVLFGCANVEEGVVWPTWLPETVSTDPELVKIYHIHTLLHEFFHTIEGRFKSNENAEKLVIHLPDGDTMTFGEWRKMFVETMVTEEPIYTSSYAKTYSNKMRKGMDMSDVAASEQLSESFAALILDHAPSDEGYESFSAFDFGNKNVASLLLQGYGSKRHKMMAEFYEARFEDILSEKK